MNLEIFQKYLSYLDLTLNLTFSTFVFILGSMPFTSTRVDQTTPITQFSNTHVINIQLCASPFMTALRPIFTPTKNFDFNSEDENDLDYTYVAG